MIKNITLSQNELSVILGGLLGDSSYHKRDNIIIFSHSKKQKEYLEWKHSILKNISKDIKTYNRGLDINGNDLFNCSFGTKSNSVLKKDYLKIGRLIFKDDVKYVSRKWLNMLTPLSLAVWWMDDGCLSIHDNRRYGKLCTHCFSLEEHYIIQKYFKTVWDIDVQITPEKKYYFIRLNVTNLKKLFKIIAPYVIQVESMIYKIDLDYKTEKYIGEDYLETYNLIKDTLNNI